MVFGRCWGFASLTLVVVVGALEWWEEFQVVKVPSVARPDLRMSTMGIYWLLSGSEVLHELGV